MTSPMTLKLRVSIVAFAVAVAGGSSLAYAQGYPMVGGAAMYPTKTIVENAASSADHTTLVAAVKAAGLVETLSGPGPLTVLAPTNTAFGKLPAGTVDTLVKPENKATLTNILTYHVIPGKISARMIARNAMQHGGKATYATVNGGTVTFMKQGAGWAVMDAKGGMAAIAIADVAQSNGVIHVIDTVLMP
ncbi:fasciclin domain-containing protein [Sphingomonas qilianensis]|uniref:Fasciclin domain-containing protein n=1 Tax=Sphingomonas qilianensis TaxID=1736690 RepID=A0ABU9XT90_9SPHN